MSYKIKYTAGKRSRNPYLKLPILILTFFFLFCILVEAMWPNGAVYLETLGILSDRAVTVSALNDLADELRYGDGLRNTLRNLIRNTIA